MSSCLLWDCAGWSAGDCNRVPVARVAAQLTNAPLAPAVSLPNFPACLSFVFRSSDLADLLLALLCPQPWPAFSDPTLGEANPEQYSQTANNNFQSDFDQSTWLAGCPKALNSDVVSNRIMQAPGMSSRWCRSKGIGNFRGFWRALIS